MRRTDLAEERISHDSQLCFPRPCMAPASPLDVVDNRSYNRSECYESVVFFGDIVLDL
jgi:hypothetical protein